MDDMFELYKDHGGKVDVKEQVRGSAGCSRHVVGVQTDERMQLAGYRAGFTRTQRDSG